MEVAACHTPQLRCLVRATAHPTTMGIVNFSADTYTNSHTSLCARCRFSDQFSRTHSEPVLRPSDWIWSAM